jgi:hypothetical protein
MTMPFPHHQATALPEVFAAIERVNRYRTPGVADLLHQVREVVVIASSSRGGSSIFTEILRQSPELMHCKGEINPFLVIAGLTYPASGHQDDHLAAMDAGPHQAAKLAVLEREMALDAGINIPLDLSAPGHRERFLTDLLWRVTIQWPEVRIAAETLFACAEETLAELCHTHGWPPGTFSDPQLFHCLFLARLRRHYPIINPHSYDLNPELIRRYCPEAAISPAPPAGHLIEEPPLVVIAPRHPLSLAVMARSPLLLKTPSNVYRLEFLQQLFPQARFRVLHLTRNPADAINGLVDGWLYPGFFSHRLGQRLNIKGYSDRFPEWGREWWKYDLPPGWQEWTDEPLERVCGFQWRKAHQTILDFLDRQRVDSLRVAFEEVIGPVATRERTFHRIASWLGVDPAPLITAATGDLPPVMATSRPRQRRWFKKAALLLPVLADPAIIATAQRLGYEVDYANHDQ